MGRISPGSPTAFTSSTGTTSNVNLTQVGGASIVLGQALAASSIPVVLTAAQLTTLTPITGGATASNQTSGGQKTQIVDGSGNVIASSSNSLNVALIAQSTDYYPMYNQQDIAGIGQLARDPSGALVTRGAVITDEGVSRANFTGVSITTSPGTATFTNGSYTVTGSGFSSADINFLDYIKLGADSESAWAQISFINSDTQITLFTAYTGTGGTGAYNASPVGTITGTGATISVASGQLTVALGTNTSAASNIYIATSSPSFVLQSSFSLSQRVANQDIYFGGESAKSGTIRAFVRFHFTGTDNTKVVTETGYNPTTTPSASETESNTVTLPNSATTASANTYRIYIDTEQAIFYINGIVVATHLKKIPHKNVNVYYCNLRGINSGAITNTNIVSDYILSRDFDILDVSQRVYSYNAGSSDSTTTRVVEANNSGKTIQTKAGSVNSSGNNTLVTAGTNRLKVFAYMFTTTSTTAITCILQDGASGTAIWEFVLQAPSAVSTGANMVVQPPAWIFATSVATLLNLNLSTNQTVFYSLAYFDES